MAFDGNGEEAVVHGNDQGVLHRSNEVEGGKVQKKAVGRGDRRAFRVVRRDLFLVVVDGTKGIHRS